MILPMGYIPDYEKASDEALSHEISFCRSVIQLIDEALASQVHDETINGSKQMMNDRLRVAEEELERRFLLS